MKMSLSSARATALRHKESARRATRRAAPRTALLSAAAVTISLLGSIAAPGLGLSGLGGPALAQSQPSAAPSWDLSGDAKLTDDGVFKIDSGRAVSNGPAFQDGTVQFEFQPSGGRSFVYMQFRVNDTASREEIYFRPHKSNAPDALQYTPVIAGSSQWQLFWGANGTTAVPMPAESWVKVRAEFKGRTLVVFVGSNDEPAMVIPRMATEPSVGTVALRSFIPAGSDAPFGARFRNVEISTETAFDFGSIDQVAAAADVIRSWQAVPPFAADTKTFSELPEVDESTWRDLATEPDGAALLHRMGRAHGTRVNATVVRLSVPSDTDRIRTLDLGFSDSASVFLNGKPLGSLDHSYSFQRPRVQGLMGLHQSRWHLPLSEGDNELRIVIVDSFGGWGVMGRWVD